MEKQFFIIIGRSGCGKGTQAELLKDYLSQKGLSNVIHLSTGEGFREFSKGENYVATLSRYTNDQGGLQPEFLAVWNWSNIFINKLNEDDSVILDGAPRKVFEKDILHSAIKFFGFERPKVIYLDVSESWAKERLNERKRHDDTEEDIKNRMEWFNTEVLPVVSAYRDDERYDFIHVNGEKEMDEVHKEIIQSINL